MNRLLSILFYISLIFCFTWLGTFMVAEAANLQNGDLLFLAKSICKSLPVVTTSHETYQPKQIIIDYSDKTPIGLTAYYDKAAGFEKVMLAIKSRYSQPTIFTKSPLMALWRLKKEKLAINLTCNNESIMLILLFIQPKTLHKNTIP